MDSEYRKHNGICQQCGERAEVDGLCYWHYQEEYGRRKNVKTRYRIKTKKKADGTLLSMWSRGTGEVQMPYVSGKGGREQKKVYSQNDARRKRENVCKGNSKAAYGKGFGSGDKAQEIHRGSNKMHKG